MPATPEPAPPPVPPASTAVLYLDPPLAELAWQEGGQQRYRAVPVGEGPQALVAAARELVRGARRVRQVTVCLAPGLFDTHQCVLPPMPDLEAAAVLQRRAANGLGVELSETLFWAQRCRPAVPEKNKQVTWLVHGRRRPEQVDLFLRMRRARIGVRRVIAAADVMANLLEGHEIQGGHILLWSTGRSLHIHLMSGGELVQESHFNIQDFEERTATYAAAVQDVRQFAAFWARNHRGAILEAVHLFGFAPEEVEELSTPLSVACTGASVEALDGPEEEGFDALRSKLLQAFVRYASSAQDLRVPLPARSSRIAAGALAASILAGLGAIELVEHWRDRGQEHREDIRLHEAGATGLTQRLIERETYLAAEHRLRETVAGLGRVAARGLALDEALAHVFATLGDSSRLGHLSFEEAARGTLVQLECSLPPPAGTAVARLDQLRRQIALDPRWRDVLILPSSRVPDPATMEDLTFTFRGTFAEGGA